MELLEPRGLWLLAGLAPLLALYILRVRRPSVTVGSTWLWQGAQRDRMARHPFRRLLPEATLLLELFALAALAVALARPAGRSGPVRGDHVALVVDTSASMGARFGDGTRMSAAKEAATRVLAALAPGADAFVVEAAEAPRVWTAPERDRGRLEAAVSALSAREVEGDLGASVAVAADRLRSLGGAGRIVVVTDGALARPATLGAAGVAVDVVTVGDPRDNAAVVRVDVRASADPVSRREEVQAFAVVRNYGAHPLDTFVTATVDGHGEPAASRRVRVPASGKAPVVLAFEPQGADRGRPLRVTITEGGALGSDDTAFAIVPEGARLPVLVAGGGAPSWFARALAADRDVDLRTLSLADLAAANVPPDAFIVVEGACPAALPGRDALVVAPPAGSCMGVDVGEKVQHPRVTSWERGDPRLRYLTLDGVHVRASAALSAAGPSASLVRAGRTTLMADASVPGRTLTVLGFAPEDSDWPLEASFVVFTRNLIEGARERRSRGGAAGARTGEPLRVAVPAEVRRVTVTGPDGSEREVPTYGGFAVVGGVDRAGLYRVRWSEPHVAEVWVPVNLTSERESDLSPRPVSTEVQGTPGAPGVAVRRVGEAHREWGWVFVALFVFCIVADGFVATASRREGRAPWPRAATAAAAGAFVVAAVPVVYGLLDRRGSAGGGGLRFAHPGALLVGLVALPVLAARLSRGHATVPRWRRRLVTALSLAATLSAVLVLADAEVGRPLDRLTHVLVVDRSRSIDLVPGAEGRIAAERKVAELSMRPGDRVATVVFGAEAAVLDPPRPRSEAPPPQAVEIGRDGTDLEGALRRGLSELPSDSAGRVVLVTDGVATRGDVLSAAAAAVAAAVPVDAVLLEQKPVANVHVASVRAKARVSEGETFELSVVIESGAATPVEVRVKEDGVLLHAARATIGAGEDVLRIPERAGGPGLHRFDVEVTALDERADGMAEDNAAAAFVRVRGPSRALVLEGDGGKGAPLARALEAAGFVVEERTGADVPRDLAGLAPFDLVTLSDIAAPDLAPSQIDALASFARDLGGGVLLLGGERSLGPGGYAGTALEEVSPVSFDLKNDERRASLAEIIVIDDSGSMGAAVGKHTKLSLANEAAVRSASLLGTRDRLGVAHVDDHVAWTVALAPVVDKPALERAIRGVRVGGGGIFTDIALDAAYGALAGEVVNLKHVLLFADGDDAERIAGCRAKVTAALRRGVTTSVISLGRGRDTAELEVLSRLGKGRFYLIDDATKLPAVFTQETILAARSSLQEAPFRVAVGAPSLALGGVAVDEAPPLQGYVVTAAKPRAVVALTGPEGDPVLATWSVGVGHVAAFTSDFKDRWGAAWLKWSDGARLFGQLGRALARAEEDGRVRLESDTAGGELHVRATVVGDDGRAQSFRRLVVRVAGPDGAVREAPLDAVGAGLYAAALPLSRPGAYVVSATDEATGAVVGTTAAELCRGEELRPTGSDRALLARVTAMTGGKMRDTLAGLFSDRSAQRFAYASLAGPLVVLAALSLVGAVAARRLAVPEIVAALGTGWAARATVVEARAAPAATSRVYEEAPRRADAAAAAPPSPPSPPAPDAPAPLTSAEVLARRRRERR